MEVRRSAIATCVVMALVMALCVGSARAADATTFTITQLCASQTPKYVVPNGITKLQVTAVGEAGLNGSSDPAARHGAVSAAPERRWWRRSR